MTFGLELNVLIGCGGGESGGEDGGDSYGDDGSLQGHLLGWDCGIGSRELRDCESGLEAVALAGGQEANRSLDGNSRPHVRAAPGVFCGSREHRVTGSAMAVEGLRLPAEISKGALRRGGLPRGSGGSGRSPRPRPGCLGARGAGLTRGGRPVAKSRPR